MENKTAVEWLVKELNKEIGIISFVPNCDEEYKQSILSLVEQANQLFQEQIEKAFDESRKTNPLIGFKWRSFDEYYKETFKSE